MGTPTLKRLAHATARDTDASRMALCGSNADGTRGIRRLGRQPDGSWVGFAGLACTVVERLIENPSDETTHAGDDGLSPILATPRHVLGAECTSLDSSPHLRASCKHLRAMEHSIAAAGGRGSALHDQIRDAWEYRRLTAEQRRAQPGHGYAALLGVLACNVPKPDWLETDDATEQEITTNRRLLEKRIRDEWLQLLQHEHELGAEWATASTTELARRTTQEGGRDFLRVVMIAWREVTDGIRAYAAKFDAHTQTDAGGARLARRLTFSNESGAIAEAGCILRALLEWQRLVRGGRTRRTRETSTTYRTATTQLRQQALQLWPPCGIHSHKAPREEILMRDEAHMGGERAATSGAAAVLARRIAKAERQQGEASDRDTHKRQRTETTGRANTLNPTTPERRTRNGDTQLRFSPGTLATLRKHTDLWEWTAHPKGDG